MFCCPSEYCNNDCADLTTMVNNQKHAQCKTALCMQSMDQLKNSSCLSPFCFLRTSNKSRSTMHHPTACL